MTIYGSPLIIRRMFPASSVTRLPVRAKKKNWAKKRETRPRTPWHVGPINVGLLAINKQPNPPDPWGHQTHGPTNRLAGPPDPQANPTHGTTRPTGPTKHRPMKTMKNLRKPWEILKNMKTIITFGVSQYLVYLHIWCINTFGVSPHLVRHHIWWCHHI